MRPSEHSAEQRDLHERANEAGKGPIPDGHSEEGRVRADVRHYRENPLALAIAAATIAALANIWVAYHNGNEQRAVEERKAVNDRTLEKQKAEDARIVSVINGDPEKARDRLRFLLAVDLISDHRTRELIGSYLDTPQFINSPSITAPSTPPSDAVQRVRVETGWLGGGHNQRDECEKLRVQVENSRQGLEVIVVGSSEENRKDFLGHVTYNYVCTFDIKPR